MRNEHPPVFPVRNSLRIATDSPSLRRAMRWLLLSGSVILTAGCLPHPREGAEDPVVAPPSTSVGLKYEFREQGIIRTALGDADTVVSGPDFVRLHITLSPRSSRMIETFALVLPPGRSPTAQVIDAKIRQIHPWNQDGIDDQTTSAVLVEAKRIRSDMAKLKYQGVARYSHLYALSLTTEIPGTWKGRRHAISEATIEIRWNPPWIPKSITDLAYSEPTSPWRTMLGGLVVNPSAIVTYADPNPPIKTVKTLTPPSGWQPETTDPNDPGWLKFTIEKEGLYAIDWHLIHDSGWDPDQIEPSQLRLFQGGKEVPTWMVGGLAKRFTIRDQLLFWGIPSDSSLSGTSTYYLGIAPKGSAPLRWGQKTVSQKKDAYSIEVWPSTTRIEEDRSLQSKQGNFLSIRDMRWVWIPLERDQDTELTFDLPGYEPEYPIDPKGIPIKIALYVADEIFPSRGELTVTLNDRTSETLSLKGKKNNPDLFLDVDPSSLKATGNRLILRWSDPVAVSAVFLDAIEIRQGRRLSIEQGEIVLESIDSVTTKNLTLEVATGTEGKLLALDLSNPKEPIMLPLVRSSIPNMADVLIPDGLQGRVGLFNLSDAKQVAAGRIAPWKDWKGTDPRANAVVITHPKFQEAAESMVKLWSDEGYSPVLVDVESLYEVYSDGHVDPAAIKSFLSDAMMRWTTKPEVVLLIGDCTSDFRGEARNQVLNYVPSHNNTTLSVGNQDRYASDLWYTTLLGDDLFADLLLGRLSVTTVEDAKAVVEKQQLARTAPPGEWLNAVGLIADHGTFESVCEEIRVDFLPPTVLPRLAYMDRYSFEDNFYLPEDVLMGDEVKVSPATTRRIMGIFEEGSTVVAFYGHGSPNIWSDQRIWFGGDSQNSDNRRLTNSPRFPLVFNGTCNTGAIDYPMTPWNVCITEDMMRQPKGGALACFVPSAPGFTNSHKQLSKPLFKAAFTLQIRGIGALTELARMAYLVQGDADEHSRMFILLGDPLASLPAPGIATDALRITVEKLEGDEEADKKSREASGYLLRVDSSLETKASEVVEWHVYGPDGESLSETATLQEKTPNHLLVLLPSSIDGYVQVVQSIFPDDSKSGKTRGRIAGDRVWLGIPTVEVKSFHRYAGDSGNGEGIPFLVELENRSEIEAFGSVVVRERGANLEWVEVKSKPFQLGPREKRNILVQTSLSPGLHILKSEIGVSPSVRPPVEQEDKIEVAVVSDSGTEMIAAVGVASVIPTVRNDSEVLLTIRAVNASIGNKVWPGGTILVTAPPMKANEAGEIGLSPTDRKSTYTLLQERSVPTLLASGESTQTNLGNIRVPSNRPIELTVRLLESNKEWESEDSSTLSYSFTFDPTTLPDLGIVGGSLKLSPETPTEGETVYFTFQMENLGKLPSPGFRISGFSYDSMNKEDRMRDRSVLKEKVEPPMRPGERRWVQKRWDPEKNLDAKRIWLVIDAINQSADLHRANNQIEMPIRIRSKWKLVPQGITITDRTDRSVTLVARIRNEGETVARFVEVAFYPDDVHTPENRLGEVLLDRVEPGETAEFRFVWTLRPEDVGRKVRPSFEAYIKGSILRITGATE